MGRKWLATFGAYKFEIIENETDGTYEVEITHWSVKHNAQYIKLLSPKVFSSADVGVLTY
ncbi:hypothetical protein [Brevibacillus formosus]|uniref:hypothetical protein n=1 Tax=Brevibacillus formosus TaxID=54913 RepID=UPI0011B2995C|nr:hypothetical protein [Brevibacillus formosus]